MKVQPCPACGARYDTSRLDVGVTFSCRRCGADVRVGDPVAPHAGGGISWSLLATGFLMLAGVFLFANPWTGYASQRWPWEQFQLTNSLLLRSTFLLWTTTAIWALFTGFAPRFQARGLVLVCLSSLLLLLCTASSDAGFAVDPKRPLTWMLGLIGMGAGLELIRSRRFDIVSRSLAGLGAFTVLWFHLRGFQPEGSQLIILIHDGWDAVRGQLTNVRPDYPWETLGAYWAFLFAAGICLLHAIGLRAPKVALAGFILIVIGLLLPAAVHIGQALSREGTWEMAKTAFSQSIAMLLVVEGVCLWLLGTFAIADLARAREGHA